MSNEHRQNIVPRSPGQSLLSQESADNPWEPSPAVLPLELDLTELPFHLPLTCETLHFLTLANPNPGPIIFRVQTTHYDNYTVSPSFGRIEAGEELEVVITIYPKTNPAFNEEHKFKFKSVAVKEKETAPLETHDQAVEYFRAWEEDPEKKGLVQKSRIRSVFVPEDEPEVSVKLEKIEE